MARHTVTYFCGHDGEVDLYGPRREREDRLAWYERNRLCPDCYRERVRREREEASAKAAEANAVRGLPALEGSEKQIAWAESLRAPVAERLSRVEVADAAWATPEALEAAKDAVVLVTEEILRQTDAKWWIDRRDGGGHERPSLGELDARWVFLQIRERHLADAWFAQAEAVKAQDDARAAEDAKVVTEADLEFDEAGRWRTARVQGRTYVSYTPMGTHIESVDGRVYKVSPQRKTIFPGLYVLDRRLSEIAEDRRKRLQRERLDAEAERIRSARVVEVERTRARRANTVIRCDNGVTVEATVPRKDSDWSECVWNGNRFPHWVERGLENVFRRIGREAERIYRRGA